MTLTPRQIEVAELVYRGRTQPEIAQELGISVHTVKIHAGRIADALSLPYYSRMLDMPRAALRAGIDAHRRA